MSHSQTIHKMSHAVLLPGLMKTRYRYSRRNNNHRFYASYDYGSCLAGISRSTTGGMCLIAIQNYVLPLWKTIYNCQFLVKAIPHLLFIRWKFMCTDRTLNHIGIYTRYPIKQHAMRCRCNAALLWTQFFEPVVDSFHICLLIAFYIFYCKIVCVANWRV